MPAGKVRDALLSTCITQNQSGRFHARALTATARLLPAMLMCLLAAIPGTTSASDSYFSGIGKSEILWRNTATGVNVVWRMDSFTRTATGVLPALGDTNWMVAGSGDFNGDGKADILWRHSVSGSNVIWLMDGYTPSSTGSLTTLADSNWNVAGVGDFGGDGLADILWRHAVTGQNIIWQMNGISIASSGSTTALSNTSWQVAGTEDFNADGNVDILWRNGATGQNVIWHMNGTAISSSGSTVALGDLNWQVAGTGDFNANGNADILWRHSATGQNVIWHMNGTAISSSGSITGLGDLNWMVADTGDYNGNGTADILWRHAVSGVNVIWLMNGTKITTGKIIPGVADTSWQIVLRATDTVTETDTTFTLTTASGYQTTAYRMPGTGNNADTAIVMLHGKTGHPLASFYSNLQAALTANGYRVIAPFMPYAGTTWDGTFPQAREVIETCAVHAARGGKQVVVIGHSLGGRTTLSYAARTPASQIKGFVPIAPGHMVQMSNNMMNATAASVATANSLIGQGKGNQQGSFTNFNSGKTSLISTTPLIYVSFYDPNVFPDLRNFLDDITTPVLWVAGQSDRITTSYGMQGLFNMIPANPKSQYSVLPGDHFTVIDNSINTILNWVQ